MPLISGGWAFQHFIVICSSLHCVQSCFAQVAGCCGSHFLTVFFVPLALLKNLPRWVCLLPSDSVICWVGCLVGSVWCGCSRVRTISALRFSGATWFFSRDGILEEGQNATSCSTPFGCRARHRTRMCGRLGLVIDGACLGSSRGNSSPWNLIVQVRVCCCNRQMVSVGVLTSLNGWLKSHCLLFGAVAVLYALPSSTLRCTRRCSCCLLP